MLLFVLMIIQLTFSVTELKHPGKGSQKEEAFMGLPVGRYSLPQQGSPRNQHLR